MPGWGSGRVPEGAGSQNPPLSVPCCQYRKPRTQKIARVAQQMLTLRHRETVISHVNGDQSSSTVLSNVASMLTTPATVNENPVVNLNN